MKSKFTISFVVGAAFSLSVVARALTTVKLAIIDPIEKHDEWIEENKKKVN